MAYEIANPSGLLDYQVRNAGGLCEALNRFRAALDAGDTGIGKTYELVAVARERGVIPLVVCPKSVRGAWHRVAEQLGWKVHTINYEALKTKNEWGQLTKPEGYKEVAAELRWISATVDDFRRKMNEVDEKLNTGISYTQEQRQAIRGEYTPVALGKLLKIQDEAKKKMRSMKQQTRFTWNASKISEIYFDEGHRCKAPGSQNAKALIAAKRQNIPVIVASATPAQSPLDMRALGYVLGLHNGVEFWSWCKRNGCKPARFGGLQFVGGALAMKKIHEQIFPSRGVRTRREDLGDAFPECQITAELYDLDHPETVDALYAEMGTLLEQLEKDSSRDVDLDHPLTQLLRVRQKIELLKVPLFEELATDALEEGLSVAMFVNFDATMDVLIQRLGITACVRGEQTASERDEAIDKFQKNQSRMIICNIKAGGVGVSLHDLDGKFPRLSLISPTYSAPDMIQVLGRIWRQKGMTKAIQRVVLAAKTVEERIHSRFNVKAGNISMLNDGDLNPLFR